MPLPDPHVSKPPDLGGRVVLITGATGGLGRVLSLACARAGATVVLHGRVVRKLEALYDEIVEAGHPEPAILPLDFLKAGTNEFSTAAGALRTQLGRLDALVHTAALLGSLGPIEHQSFERWLEVLRIDVAAAMGITRAMLPLMADASDGAVVLTLDTRGQAPRAYWGAYAAAKAGLMAYAATLADEWENRTTLRINAVVPGPINTPLRMLSHPGEEKSSMPLPDALVALYLHLVCGQPKSESGVCVDAATWLTGGPGAAFALRGAQWGAGAASTSTSSSG